MRRLLTFGAAFLSLLIVSACAATSYRNGYAEREVEPGIWLVKFRANGLTNEATIRDYWLYRCTQLTIEKGDDGFEILSPQAIGSRAPAPGFQPAAYLPAGDGAPHQASRPILASSPMILIIPNYMPPPRPPEGAHDGKVVPYLEGSIRLLKKPFEHHPPRVYDARLLQSQMAPYINGPKCDDGNLCPHDRWYTRPPRPNGG